MNVFLIGANGQIGTHLVDILNQNEQHNVSVALRKEEQISKFQHKNVQPILMNLEDRVDEIANKINDADVVVFTAGSGGSTGYDKTLLIDLDGAIKSIEASEKAGVTQFVMVSAFGADNRQSWVDEIKPYYAAKYYADKWLEQSKLNYTIVRPGALTNDPGVGTATTSSVSDNKQIPREDVAACLAKLIGNKKAYNKSFNLLPGNIRITDLVKEL
jgi:nucleoside-diphosphate-sugar epimerase